MQLDPSTTFSTLVQTYGKNIALWNGALPLPQRVYAGIHLNHIADNFQWYKDHTGPDTKVCAVIKTDAYGHGAVPVAKALEQIGVDYFAVATVEEGVELREFHVTEPILVLGHVFPDVQKKAVEYGLTLTVFSYENAAELSALATSLGKTLSVHLKADTGMGRIGFVPGPEGSDTRRAVVEAIKNIYALSGLSVDGIFTHFAKADWADKTSMNAQVALFQSLIKDLEGAGLDLGVRHMCNSAAGMELDENFLDMVRVGITLYGLWPSDEVQKDKLPLKPGMSLVSHVSNVKEVGPGFPVGYGSTYVTTKERTVIATVPVGYGDGYPRSLSNKGYVLLHGQKAPIVGRVCMDQFMVDVTDITPGVSQGDEVVLLGTQAGPDGDATITMEELSDLSGRFNYEFACDINHRVPRVYLG